MRPEPETAVGLPERAATLPDAGIRVLDRAEREIRRSWREIRERASRIAGGLRALGVAPGETVALVFLRFVEPMNLERMIHAQYVVRST